jgi:hypothetical protein
MAGGSDIYSLHLSSDGVTEPSVPQLHQLSSHILILEIRQIRGCQLGVQIVLIAVKLLHDVETSRIAVYNCILALGIRSVKESIGPNLSSAAPGAPVFLPPAAPLALVAVAPADPVVDILAEM